MRDISSYIDNTVLEGFYKNVGTRDYVILKKAIEELNQINIDWKHNQISVRNKAGKVLKKIESVIDDFALVQRCIKGYTSHYIYHNRENSNSDKWWTVGTLYINTTSDNSVSINNINIDTGSNKYIGYRILCEIESGLVEEFELGVIKNDKIEII